MLDAVVLGVDGISDFEALRSRQHNEDVQLYAFDVLSIAGEDLRSLPLHIRKNNLKQQVDEAIRDQDLRWGRRDKKAD